MRVLEIDAASTYSMGRKSKHKLRKSKENDASDSSEDISGRGCTHINKAISFNSMKKGLSKQVFGECAGCAKEASTKKSEKTTDELGEGATGIDFLEEVEPTLWVCLQCGYQGCDRNSQGKHALKHHETPRSSSHCVVINTTTWSAWCYDCDDEVNLERFKKLAECMEHIKKIACVPTVDITLGRNGSGSGGASSSADGGTNKGRPQTPKGAASSNSMCQKVKGLSNLGNTCFFNAVMQNLIQTYSLENLLGERKKGRPFTLIGNDCLDIESGASSDDADDEKDLKPLPSIEISLSDPGPLTHSLVVFLHEMNTNSRSSIVNPSALFGQVCKKAPRFKGFQQQDSHELLRYLLDNMRTEEIKRGQSGILKHFKLSENLNPKKVDDDTKKKVKIYGRRVKHTFVECLFGGQLISTVVCEECKYISQVLEPFLDLSLPVTEEKPQRPNQAYGARKKEIKESVTEVKEEKLEAADGWVMKEKEDKTSKHQTKKQKRQAKKEAKKAVAKNKVAPAIGDEEKNEDEEEKDEKEDSKEDEVDGKDGTQEERCDASDADVEDNLESDTSRCYTQAVDVSLQNEESLLGHMAASGDKDESAEYQSFSLASQDSQNSSLLSGATGLAASGSSGPIINGVTSSTVAVSDSVTGENISVSYTFSLDGMVSEDAPATVDAQVSGNCVDGVTATQNGETSVCDHGIGDNSSTIQQSENVSYKNTTEKTIVNGNGILASDSDSEKDRNLILCTNQNAATSLPRNENTSAKIQQGLVSGIQTLSINGPVTNDHDASLSDTLGKLTLNGDSIDGAAHSSQQNNSAVNSLDSCEKSPCHFPAVGLEGSCKNLNHADQGEERSVSEEVQYNKQPCSLPVSPTEKTRWTWKEFQKEGQRKSVNPLVERYHPTPGECSIESCLHQFTSAELLTGNNKFGCKNCNKIKQKQNPNKEKKEVVYSNASKQFLIFVPPAVLTLHLKRFEQVGFSSRKVNRHVEFPFILDLAPYCSSLCQNIKRGQKKILYSLYGVVEHSGRLTSGHYTAYVKVRPNIETLTNFLNIKNVTIQEYLYKYAQRNVNGEGESEVSDDGNTDALIPPGRWFHISDSRVNEVTEASVERAQAYLLFYERVY